MNNIFLAFQVTSQQLPTPDDIICCTSNINKLVDILRARASAQSLLMSTSGNPVFQYEYRREDNTIHSFIAIKEMPVL